MKTKSYAGSFFLTVFFGPLGLLYASPLTGAIMTGFCLLAIGLTGGIIMIFLWPACLLISLVAVFDHNGYVNREADAAAYEAEKLAQEQERKHQELLEAYRQAAQGSAL